MHGEHTSTSTHTAAAARNQANPTVPRNRYIGYIATAAQYQATPTVPQNRPAPTAVPRNRYIGTVPRNRRHPAALYLAAALAAIGALAGCTTTPDKPSTIPNGPTTTTTPATPTTPEPTRPPDAATPASAIAFVRYFWDLYNYAYATYNTAPLKAISDPKCKYCASTITDVKHIADAKTLVKGFEMQVLESASPPVKITTGTLVVNAIRQRDGAAIHRDGTTSKLKGFANARFTVAVAWSNGKWSVHGVDFNRPS